MRGKLIREWIRESIHAPSFVGGVGHMVNAAIAG